ncbi:hypothetical protein D3C80_1905520 [compost metagenome]
MVSQSEPEQQTGDPQTGSNEGTSPATPKQHGGRKQEHHQRQPPETPAQGEHGPGCNDHSQKE